jgi:hypothetical protein
MSEWIGDKEEDQDDSIAREVLPPEAAEASGVKKEFKPWHKPRKQKVRKSWAYNADRLMGKLEVPAGGGRIFRYLTLPGSDMLDIRSMKEALKRRGFKLHYLAFNAAGRNSAEERSLTLSANEISRHDWIDNSSKIVWQRLENLVAAENTDAYEHARKHGPYHAINLDLCDCLAFKDSSGARPSGLDVLGKLFQLQTERCNHDWLLFIATRIERSIVSTEYLERFVAVIQENAVSSEDFRTGLEALFQRYDSDLESVLAVPDGLPLAVFKDLFSVGLSKWLLKYLGSTSPRWGLRMLRSYCYSVEGGEPDMLSLVYRIEHFPQRSSDADGILEGQQPPSPPPDETCYAKIIVEKTTQLEDLDSSLQQDPDLFGELIQETAGLLQEANYDVTSYVEWARNSQPG